MPGWAYQFYGDGTPTRGGSRWSADSDRRTRDRASGPYGVRAGLRCGLHLLQPFPLYEDGPAADGVAGGVELVAVEPEPTVVGRPVEHPDHPEHDRPEELDTRRASHVQNVTGAGKH